MKHPETKRIVPGARCAVLFIHGIVGTPNHFRQAIDLERLVPEEMSVWNLRLPGHGYGVKEFARSSGDQWRNYVRGAFLELAENHEAVLIVGHSMGTLFSLQLEREFPGQVAGMFLLNVPLRPWLRLWGIGNCLRLALGCVRTDRPREAGILAACGAEPTPFLLKYLTWLPGFVDLFKEIYRTERSLSEPGVAYRIFQSSQDELVSNLTARVLRKNGLRNLTELADSSHFYYPDGDCRLILEAFAEMLCEISTKE